MSDQCILQHLSSVSEKKMGQGTERRGDECIGYLACDKAKKDYQVVYRNNLNRTKGLVIILLFLLVVIVFGIVLGVTVSKLSSVSEEIVTYASCPDGWIGYLGTCYYFSEEEADWLSSHQNCASLDASLSFVETDKEMSFLLRYKGPIYHWIGLRKPQEDHWEWANGQIFNNTLFDIVEGGNCAYLNDVKVMSSWCKTKKNWICSKPDTYMQRRKLLEERREAGP